MRRARGTASSTAMGMQKGKGALTTLKSETERIEMLFLCNQWQWWVISSNSTNLGLVEHPLRRSTKLVNLALRSTFLVNPNLVELECLANFLGSEAVFGGSGAEGAVPNRP